MSILNKIVSFYQSKEATARGVEMCLLALLTTDKHKQRIMELRSAPEAEQAALKLKLPCFTVAGTFSRRANDCLLQPSGLAAVDLDSAEDYNTLHLLTELKKIDSIAYAGLSCRGKRIFCIVPFKYPDKYEKQYERLVKSFEDMGLPMGDCCHKSISQPRFISWNDANSCFFRHDAKPYILLPAEKKVYNLQPRRQTAGTSTNKSPFDFSGAILQKQGNHFTEGNRHNYIFHLSCLLNKMGVSQHEAEQWIYTNLLPASEIKSNCIASPYKQYSAEFNTWDLNGNTGMSYVQAFRQPEAQQTAPKQPQQAVFEAKQGFSDINTRTIEPESWTNEITELENYFAGAPLPAVPVKIKPHETITNIPLFIHSHFATVKAQNGKRAFLPYLNRLQELKQILNLKNNLT